MRFMIWKKAVFWVQSIAQVCPNSRIMGVRNMPNSLRSVLLLCCCREVSGSFAVHFRISSLAPACEQSTAHILGHCTWSDGPRALHRRSSVFYLEHGQKPSWIHCRLHGKIWLNSPMALHTSEPFVTTSVDLFLATCPHDAKLPWLRRR